MWDFINFVILLILVVILIAVIVTFVIYFNYIKNCILDVIENVSIIIPSGNFKYTDIDFSDEYNLNAITSLALDRNSDSDSSDLSVKRKGSFSEGKTELVKGPTFNFDLAKFLININMLSYNISSKYDYSLPKYLIYKKHINNCIFIYKIKNEDIYILSFRGTRTGEELLLDLDSVQTTFKEISKENALVHRGFYNWWKQSFDELKRFFKNKAGLVEEESGFFKKKTFILTGHSLGSASAAFTSLYLHKYFPKNHVILYMFASPRLGNDIFLEKLNEMIPESYSIINKPDMVPGLPPMTLSVIGHTYVYDDFKNIITLDIQKASVFLNHRLDTYKKGLLLRNNDNVDVEAIWHRNPIIYFQ